MALIDSQPFSAATGRLLLAETSAAEPTYAGAVAYIKENTPITGFEDIGHTSRDGFLNDGTDATTEVQGSYQNESLVEVETESATSYVTTDSLQVSDPKVLDLYYGGQSEAGKYVVPQATGTSVERSMLLIRESVQGKVIAEYYPKVSVSKNGRITWPTKSFALVPLRFTILKATGKNFVEILSDDFTATP